MRRIGVDLGGTKIEGVVLGADGEIVARERVSSPSHSYGALLQAVVDLVRGLRLDHKLDGTTPVGIGTPGAWQPSSRTMKNCNSTVLNGQPLFADLRKNLGDHVRMANDADCFALSEAVDGAAESYATVFGVILGTGVGGGLVVNKSLLSGPNAIAGEWGHTPVPYLRHPVGRDVDPAAGLLKRLEDRLCYCGRYNCIETFLSGPGLARTADALLGKPCEPEAVFSDPANAVVRDLYCDLLARSLAQLINVLDPAAVVLGGGLSQQSVLYERVPQVLPRYLFSPDCHTRLLPPTHGDSSGVRGAAWL